MQLNNIAVTYCSNYNGCYLTTEDGGELCGVEEYPEYSALTEACVEKIVNHAVDDCDEDGEFRGCSSDLKAFAITAVKLAFGDNVNVTFEVDRISS